MVETMRERDGVAGVDVLINNAGYFYEPHETLETMNFEEQLKQIDICGVGPLRASRALLMGGMIQKGAKIVIISSQAGSVEWRYTQNPSGGDYGHHMSRASCNMGAVLLSQELKSYTPPGASEPTTIPVVLLHPGFNRTEMTAKFAEIWDVEGAPRATSPARGAPRRPRLTPLPWMASHAAVQARWTRASAPRGCSTRWPRSRRRTPAPSSIARTACKYRGSGRPHGIRAPRRRGRPPASRARGEDARVAAAGEGAGRIHVFGNRATG